MTVKSVLATTDVNGSRLEPRCRVCRNDRLRATVNGLLALGVSYAMIVRNLGDDNAELDAWDRVAIDSVRNHCARHFPVQNVARATYREILERRARENAVDFVEGVATAITLLAFLETVVVRAYETLVDEDSAVSVDQGVVAARELGKLTAKDDDAQRWAQVHAKQAKIVAVFREFIPPEQHQEFLDRLEGRTSRPPGGARPAMVDTSPATNDDFDSGDDDFDSGDDDFDADDDED